MSEKETTFQVQRVTVAAILIFGLIINPLSAHAQDEGQNKLTINLRRRIGYGLAGQMQGTFSVQVEAPEEVTRVIFFLDGEIIGEDSQHPYNLQFKTASYEAGVHSFTAIGYTDDGTEYSSGPLTRQFVARSPVLLIVAIIVILAIVLRLASSYIANRGSTVQNTTSYGFMGGAICPNCSKPFIVHWWSINLVGTRIDRCPHCKKWHAINRASVEELSAAESRAVVTDTTDVKRNISPDSTEDLDHKIDQSRYENS